MVADGNWIVKEENVYLGVVCMDPLRIEFFLGNFMDSHVVHVTVGMPFCTRKPMKKSR
jgi:hypothetical protein